MNSDLLNGSKNWENFVNGNKIIFGCPYMLGKIHFTILKRLAEGLPYSLLTKWENFVKGNKIIFGCLYIALWSS